MNYLTTLVGDCRETLKTLDDRSVQMVCTSPPYFNLRSYLPDGHEDKGLEIGAEQTPQEFVTTLVSVFAKVHRVLKDDGVLFVNLADSYSQKEVRHRNGESSQSSKFSGKPSQVWAKGVAQTGRKLNTGLKEKDMCLIPQRFVIAMQDAGWYVRDQIAWVKRAPMPESVVDRFTKAWEPIFMFTKAARYYFDIDAVKEPSNYPEDNRKARQNPEDYKAMMTPNGQLRSVINPANSRHYEMRRMRNAWILSPESTKDCHFATFPTEIPRRCILAASKAGDTVLDPFFGAGTTGLVAAKLGRRCIGIELNPEYVALARKRIAIAALPLFDSDSHSACDKTGKDQSSLMGNSQLQMF